MLLFRARLFILRVAKSNHKDGSRDIVDLQDCLQKTKFDAAAKSRTLEIGQYRDPLVRGSVGGTAAAA